ncbi:LacI family transcriptional regulator [Paenibacillus psychroresistens]|uniref:LacI family transcriptional regulator n=1 Tax=Paenibacillus psychroresistens TaxID=1778678 RepID=A0A6B8RUD2_9BACL|nr:LacI family DNA-binding transcriptional regulator [Paenibacillus psychroresistens]QGQ99557.1 LacI family transcriptional regulator [Paenibacillus psychroresistens]
MIQLKDVAELAGVSTGSVSKVLNGYAVSPRMKKSVELAIAELNYKPNMVARSLRTKTSNSIGVMVPYTNDPYFMEFFRGVSIGLSEKGKVPFLFSTEPHDEFSAQKMQQIFMRGVDGLIVSTYGWKDSVLEELYLIAEKIPVVSYKRSFPGTAIHSVGVDDCSGMFKAVEHLTSIGHRRIGYIASGLNLDTGQQRLKGYQQALEQAGIAYEDNLVVESAAFQIEDGYNAVQQLLKRFPLPSAIVGANNSVAIGALKFLESRNVKIPEDIAVMGYDDEPLSTLVTPKLSSVSVPVYEMTAKAVQIIEDAILGVHKETINILFPTTLKIRNSTDFSATAAFEFERFSR